MSALALLLALVAGACSARSVPVATTAPAPLRALLAAKPAPARIVPPRVARLRRSHGSVRVTIDPDHGPVKASSLERLMARLLNNTRRGHHLAGLKLKEKLTEIARDHSRLMARSDSIFHSKHLVRALMHLKWKIAGENVGAGESIRLLHIAFLSSTSHRRNILRAGYRSVGVGVVLRGDLFYITVLFTGR